MREYWLDAPEPTADEERWMEAWGEFQDAVEERIDDIRKAFNNMYNEDDIKKVMEAVEELQACLEEGVDDPNEDRY